MIDSNSSQKFIVLDFNCSNEYTHHWSSLVAYCDLLIGCAKITEVWLPRGSAPQIISRIPSEIKVRKILRSPQYSRIDFLSDPLGLLMEKFLMLFLKLDSKIFYEPIKRYLINFYIHSLSKKIIDESKVHNISIVFPTLDFLGLELVKTLLSLDPKLKIYARRMGSEQKHPFSNGYEFQDLLKMIDLDKFENLNVGIPTWQLFKEVYSASSHPEKIFWSPLPPQVRGKNLSKVLVKSTLNIGFPGAVKKRKGYDYIPAIVEKLISEDIEFKIYIQSALFPWETYVETREKIKKLAGERLIELEPAMSVESYEQFFSKYDLVILPYDSDSYSNADSGVLYEASDFGIPIACFNKLGFSDEAFHYGIGVDLEKIGSFIDLIKLINNPSISDKISNYNEARKIAVLDFLGITHS